MIEAGESIVLFESPEALLRHLEHPTRAPEGARLTRARIAHRLSDADLDEAFDLAARMGLPMVDLAHFPIRRDAIESFPAEAARRLRALPLVRTPAAMALAVDDVTNAQALAALDFVSKVRVVLVAVTRSALRGAIARYYDNAEDTDIARQLGLDPRDGESGSSLHEMERLSREKPVVKLIHGLIAQAVYRRASDIHFRPGEDSLELLYRIDDELVPVRRFLRALAPALVSRVKVLGSMNLAEHRLPQDGRTTFTLDDGRAIDLRISIMPTVFGESVVVRLLDTEESLKTLDEIGLNEADRIHVEEIMQRSHGMFLTTGPTGCGKSTTLYAMLLEMRRQRINILTIEDPVEFHIADVQQMQVNRPAGFTFANAMRNFLRHDPDAIMVGEIRDRETADIAVESSLTGHLVLSTLHTNTAATTVTRLLDLGVEPYLLRASLAAVMAQRLVRLTCPHCLVDDDAPAYVREALDVEPGEVFKKGAGCAHCNGLGVFKRAAVYELLRVTPAVRHCITRDAEADTLHEVAVREGMVPITQAALAMARSTRISLSEAYRVRAD
jgi:type IV pilus assembly protein PilB